MIISKFACKSPSLWLPLWRTCVDHHHHQHFLVYVNSRYLVGHRFLLAWKRQNIRRQPELMARLAFPGDTSGYPVSRQLASARGAAGL
jgi:hypothetical protein